MIWKCIYFCNLPKSVFPTLCRSVPFEAKPSDCQWEYSNSLYSAFYPIIFRKKKRPSPHQYYPDIPSTVRKDRPVWQDLYTKQKEGKTAKRWVYFSWYFFVILYYGCKIPKNKQGRKWNIYRIRCKKLRKGRLYRWSGKRMVSLQGKSNYVFPVLPWKYWSTAKEVLQYFQRSTAILLRKYCEPPSHCVSVSPHLTHQLIPHKNT